MDDFRKTTRPARNLGQAMRRGAIGRCPQCGTGAMFRAYLKVSAHCPSCGEALHHERADDAPPYMTIFLVGHIVVPLALMVERVWKPDMWIHTALWLPLSLILALGFLPIAKGALVGLQWALFMHGFDPDAQPEFNAGIEAGRNI